MMAARFCNQCGASLDENARFCTNCGTPVPVDHNPNQQNPQQQYQQQQYQQQQYQQPQYQQPYQQQQYQNFARGNQFSQNSPTTPCPDNYLALSIIVTILCAWPLGIPAIVNAAKVNKLWNAGDYAGAQEASEKAKKWSIASAVVAIIIIGIAVIVAATS